jgi:3-hydroxy-9,10-secoandrosta-1,3,5(10)-triene-9,17-dione monooxygenase
MSFADIGFEEAMRRARDLVPFLRCHAEAIDANRRMIKVVEDELHRSGLVRAMQPKLWGGMELGFAAAFDIFETLARGDCSVAWCVTNLALHHRTLAHFSLRAQEEVWGENPQALIAAGIAYPQGRARLVDGGVELSGYWNFCSGIDVSGWNMLACVVREGETVVDYRYCLLRVSEHEVFDEWRTLGMRGTSSASVKCDRLFVPEHRTQSMFVTSPQHEFPGLKVHANTLYKAPISALGGQGPAACIVGNAQAALDTMIESVKARSTSYTGARMRDFQTVQLRIGMAGAKIDTARLTLRHDCQAAEAIILAGGTLDTETKLRIKRNTAYAVRLAVEAVDMLHEMAGANGIYDQFPLQRMFRDARSAAAHIHFNVDVQMTQWGSVALGGEFTSPTL